MRQPITRLLGVLAFLLFFCQVAAAQRVQLSSQQSTALIVGRYSDLVYQFRYGSAPAAAQALALWPSEDIRHALRFAQDFLASRGKLDPLVAQATPETRQHAAEDEARYGGDVSKVLYLKGAAGLHTAVAAASWTDEQNTLVVEHTGFVGAYLLDLLFQRDDAYAAAWCRVGGTLLTGSVNFGVALKHYEQCLKYRPHDPWFLLGLGATLESAAIMVGGLPKGTALPGWDGPKDPGALAKNAAAEYDEALKQASNLDEARIRLARLQLECGDLDAAANNLSLALKNGLPPVLAYWAHLFLGSTEERAGKLDDAAGHYRAALAVYPKAQTAAIALSYVLAEGLGDRQGGSAVLRTHIAPGAAGTFDSDPWRLYAGGQAWRAPEWLGEFERRSRE